MPKCATSGPSAERLVDVAVAIGAAAARFGHSELAPAALCKSVVAMASRARFVDGFDDWKSFVSAVSPGRDGARALFVGSVEPSIRRVRIRGSEWTRLRDSLACVREAPSCDVATLIRIASDLGALAQLEVLPDQPFRMVRSPRSQKTRHAYYTPPEIVRFLLENGLNPLIGRGRSAPTIFDPACGAGHLLIASAFGCQGLIRDAIGRCYGMDIDPLAVEACRCALWLAGGDAAGIRKQITVGDSLLGPVRRTQKFDFVVANPPFQGIVKRRGELTLPDRAGYPKLGGSADLATYFVQIACVRTAQGGSVAIVLPRTFLSSPSAAGLRRDLPRDFKLSAVLILHDPSMFTNANVHVCAVTLVDGGADEVRWMERGAVVAKGPAPADGNWWWPGGEDDGSRRIGDRFDVCAGMTVEDAYEARGLLLDQEFGSEPKLVTTGLIEPSSNRWGKRPCLFLGTRSVHARIDSPRASPRLAARLERGRRPKLIVAGLGKRIECFVDAEGDCAAAVATICVFDREDSLRRLAALESELHSERAAEIFERRLGATALGGGSTTITKRFLLEYPLPPNWEEAGFGD